MSLYEVYVGPYVECKTRTEKTQVTINSCPNPGCERHGVNCRLGEKFCSKCGSQHSGVKIDVETRVPDIDDFLEDDDFCNVLYPVCTDVTDSINRSRNVQLFTPNEPNTPGQIFDPRETFDYREVDPKQIQNDCLFVTTLDAMQRLRDHYGEDNVRVKWGVLKWGVLNWYA